LALSVVSTPSFAGHEVKNGSSKNGGSVIVCPDGGDSQHIYLLDFWEHRDEYHIQGLYGRACHPGITCNTSALEIITSYMGHLNRLDSARSSRYMFEAAAFEGRKSFDLSPFADLDDRGSVPENPDCKIKQAIIRYRDEDSASIWYKVNPYTWDGLSEMNRAGLIVHEIVYGEAFDAGQTDSTKSRAFVAFLFSDEALTISPEQYRELIQTLGVPGD